MASETLTGGDSVKLVIKTPSGTSVNVSVSKSLTVAQLKELHTGRHPDVRVASSQIEVAVAKKRGPETLESSSGHC